MSAIESVLQQPAAQAVGWALLHFLWQGALIGALTALALAVLRRSAADVRYVVATIGLSLMLTMPIVTGMQTWRTVEAQRAPAFAQVEETTAADAVTLLATGADSRAFAAPQPGTRALIPDGSPLAGRVQVEPWLPLMVLAWFCGVALLTLRLLSGWVWVQRMKSHGALPARDEWQSMAVRLARRLHIRRPVRLLESTHVDVPTVIGWMKPVVLLPGATLAGLAPQQLEAILAHELAHIRRHDYLVNLAQALVETLLFYHPAVWWLSRRIRIEREHCCDDLAVSLCGDPYTYAKALADLEELRGGVGDMGKGAQLVMAATGGSLLQRVRRLLGAPSHAGREPGWLAGSAAIVVMLGIAASAVSSETPQAPPAPAAVMDIPANPSSAPFESVVAEAPRAMAGAVRQGSSAVAQLARGIAAASVPRFSFSAAFQFPPSPPAAPAPPARPMAPGFPAVAPMAGFPSTLAPPSAPGAPAPPAPPAAPGFPDAPQGTSVTHNKRTGNYTWSHNGERIQITYRGDVEFSDDDTDVVRLSPGGQFRISDGAWFGGHSVEFSADAQGQITRRYWVGASERPFDPDGRAWLAKTLPRFVRESGMGAPARVARILKAQGPSGVLAEISRIQSSWAKRVYFQELLRTASLDAGTTARLLEQAGRELKSDYELASLLISSADKLLVDDATRKAYFESARTIDSDYEMRRVYGSALKRGAVTPALLAAILDASRSLASDYEAASLLRQIAELQPLDGATRPAFFAALDTIGSDYEKRRTLSALAARSDLTQDTRVAMLEAGASLSSDHEAASFLRQIVKDGAINDPVREPFFRAVDSISSAYERGRVLQAVVQQPGLSAETVLDVLRAARRISSGHETSRVLLAVAAAVPLSGEARDLYVDAAGTLSEYEQGRVLTALVRNERRR